MTDDELIEKMRHMPLTGNDYYIDLAELCKAHYRQIALNAVVGVIPDIGMNKYSIVRKAINKALE